MTENYLKETKGPDYAAIPDALQEILKIPDHDERCEAIAKYFEDIDTIRRKDLLKKLGPVLGIALLASVTTLMNGSDEPNQAPSAPINLNPSTAPAPSGPSDYLEKLKISANGDATYVRPSRAIEPPLAPAEAEGWAEQTAFSEEEREQVELQLVRLVDYGWPVPTTLKGVLFQYGLGSVVDLFDPGRFSPGSIQISAEGSTNTFVHKSDYGTLKWEIESRVDKSTLRKVSLLNNAGDIVWDIILDNNPDDPKLKIQSWLSTEGSTKPSRAELQGDKIKYSANIKSGFNRELGGDSDSWKFRDSKVDTAFADGAVPKYEKQRPAEDGIVSAVEADMDVHKETGLVIARGSYFGKNNDGEYVNSFRDVFIGPGGNENGGSPQYYTVSVDGQSVKLLVDAKGIPTEYEGVEDYTNFPPPLVIARLLRVAK